MKPAAANPLITPALIRDLMRRGCDTMLIATALGTTEATVWNILAAGDRPALALVPSP